MKTVDSRQETGDRRLKTEGFYMLVLEISVT